MKNFLEDLRKKIGKKELMHVSIFLAICLFFAAPTHSAYAWGVGDLWSGLTGYIEGFTYQILFIILKVALWAVAFLVRFGAWLVDVMLNQALYQSILSDTNVAIKTGWTTVRDFCNMFYVFFLLLIAFATIIRTQAYNAKNLLPKVIISLFLINFSGEIARIVIDLGQVFLFGIAGNWMGTFSGSSGGAGGLTAIVDFFQNEFSGRITPSFANIVMMIFAVVYCALLGVLYVMLALFLLVRLVMFVFLIIVSPFAFFSMVLPSMRKYTTEWWGSLFSNAISGPVFVFFIYISAVMASHLSSDNDLANSAALGDTSGMNFFVPVLNVIIPHVVAMAMLWAAIPAAKKIGTAGSNQLIGGKLGIGKVITGGYAGYKIGEKAARKTMSGGASIAPAVTSRAAAWNVPGGTRANNWVNNSADRVKKWPVVGEVFIKRAADKAKENAAKIDKEKAQMENLSNKDRKTYVDQAIDPLTKAIRAQAHVDLLAKDSGKNMSKASLNSMGYSDDFLEKTYKNSKLFNLKADSQEKYRPEAIYDANPATRDEKIKEQVIKAVKDSEEGKINASSFSNKVVRDTLHEQLGDEKFYKLVNGKSSDDKFELAEDLIDKDLRPHGVLDTGVANFVATLQKSGKTIQRDVHNNRVSVGGAPVLVDASIKRTFSANPTGAVAPAMPAYRDFVNNYSGVGLGDFSKDQITEMMPHLKRAHLSNSNKISQEKKDVIIAHFHTPYANQTAANAAGVGDIWKYIDSSKDWKG